MARVDDDTEVMHALAAALRFARVEIDADVTAQRLLILTQVYLHEGLSQRELLALLEATSAPALSRNLAELSEWSPRKAPGLGLIELRADRFNLRRKQVYLTAKGRRFIARWLQRMRQARAVSAIAKADLA